MTDNDERAIAVLHDTIDYLIEHGWIQHGYGLPGASACASGAMMHVSSFANQLFAMRATEIAIKKRTGKAITVPYYNDTYCETVDDVLSLLKEAIVLVETGEVNFD